MRDLARAALWLFAAIGAARTAVVIQREWLRPA